MAEIKLLQKKKGKFELPEKNRSYLLGEYNRLIGNNELARKHFYRALKVDPASEARNANTALIVINFMLFITLLFLWIKKGFTKKSRIICTIGGIIVFVLCSFFLYMMPEIVRFQENMNNHHNKIISDRIKLLNAQSE